MTRYRRDPRTWELIPDEDEPADSAPPAEAESATDQEVEVEAPHEDQGLEPSSDPEAGPHADEGASGGSEDSAPPADETPNASEAATAESDEAAEDALLGMDPTAIEEPSGEDLDPVQIPELHEVDCPDDLREEIEALMARYPQKRSASIPALWAIQRRDGWCTPEGIRQVAAVMQITPAYLESVASFYDLLRLEPIGEQRVLVCTNISCWMRGADELLDSFCGAAGIDPHEAGHGGATSDDGKLFVSGFECLGACDIAPMASINERYYGPLEDDDAKTIVDQLRNGADVLPEKALSKRAAAGGDPAPDPRVTG